MENKQKKKKGMIFGLRNKIVLMLVIFGIIPTLVTGATSYNMAKGRLFEKLQVTSRQTTVEISRGLDHHLEGIIHVLNIISNENHIQNSNDSKNLQDALDLLENTKNTDQSIINVFYGMEVGGFYMKPYTELPPTFNHKDRDWYIQAKENRGNVIITEPYIDTASKNLVITLATTIEKNNQIVGVAGVDLELKSLSDELINTKLGDSGYVYVASKNGIIITHPNTSYIGTSISEHYDMWEKIKDAELGFEDFKKNEEDMFVTHTTSEVGHWKVIGILEYKELNKDTSSINLLMQIVLGVTLVATILIANILTYPIGKNIKIVIKALNAFSKGDMSVRVDIKSKDELGHLGEKFNNMSEKISILLKEIDDTSVRVLESSISLAQIANETSVSVSEVSKAVDEVAVGTSEQAKTLSLGVDSMNVLSKSIIDIEKSIIEMEGQVVLANKLSSQGLDRSKQLLNTSDKTKESTKTVSTLVFKTNESMDQIKAISNTIDAITSQTNLLALNASIEAARAGESGRGFAIVADEIRSLAEQSKDSTVKIKHIIENIIQQTKESASAMEDTNYNMGQQLLIVDETKEFFHNIMTSIDSLLIHVSKIKGNTKDVVETNERILDRIGYISAISQESASATEEVTASTEQIDNTMDEISKQAMYLQDLSKNLKEKMEIFNVEK